MKRRNIAFGIVILVSSLAANAAFAQAAPSAPATQPGIWKKQKYTFQFMGFTTTYSCDGLAYKLKVLLIAAGARADAKAQSGSCGRGYGSPDKFASAYLTFYTLSPASDPSAEGQPVNGVWRSVALASRSPRELALGDCELVDQFRALVLPMFTTRNIESQTTCVPHQFSGSVINLKFDVLAAVPVAKGK